MLGFVTTGKGLHFDDCPELLGHPILPAIIEANPEYQELSDEIKLRSNIDRGIPPIVLDFPVMST